MEYGRLLYAAPLFLALGCGDDNSSSSSGGSGGGVTGGTTGTDAGAGTNSGGSGGSTGAAGGTGGAAGGTGGSAGAAGGTGGSGGAMDLCAPQEIEFTPSWTPPQPIAQGVCTEEEIDAVVVACFGPPGDVFGNSARCVQAQADYPACAACMITAESASEHGAIVDYRDTRGYFDRNLHGCIAHAEGDLSDTGCGAKMKAAFDCGNEACTGCQPAGTLPELQDLNRCFMEASEGVCQAEFEAANACVATLSGPINDICAESSSTVLVARAYGHLFCGAGAPTTN